jgi:hypothetical protein
VPFAVLIALILRAEGSVFAQTPAPYVLPFQLRPAGVSDAVRVDAAVAILGDRAGGGATVATMGLGSVKVHPEMALLLRVAVVQHDPGDAPGSAAFANPALAFTYAPKLHPSIRLALTLGTAIPIGMGGGNEGDPKALAAARAGVLARSSMDNAMFAVNDVVVFPGVDLAYTGFGLTVQVEATLLQLFRARGAAVQSDEVKTNFTSGLFAGYQILDWLSLGAEVRYQRWLSTPSFVASHPTGANRDTLSFAVGPRFHIRAGDTIWIRPGIAYARGLDAPMSDGGYDIVQIDLPISF